MCFYLLPRKTRVEVRVEALRGVGVQRDVEGVHALQHPQVFGGRTQPRFDHFAARQQAGPARGEMRRSCPCGFEEDLDRAASACVEIKFWAPRASEQFRSDLALDSRDSMRQSLVGVNCTRLGLTELKLDPHHGLSVVAAPLPPSQTLPRPGEDAVCLALLDQAYPLRTAHHLARKHPVRFVMLVVYAAGLLFIFLMRRQD